MNEKKIYVSLDLGSESMAAYYSDPYGEGRMVKLQYKGPELLGMTEDEAKAELAGIGFLIDESSSNDDGSNENRSPRLWNRISFNQGFRENSVTDDHARLVFADQTEYERSLFRFFQRKGAWPGSELIMPNPKILFQHQVREILPLVRSADGSILDLEPQTLIGHLTLQVIVNFVLNSRELEKFDRDDIYLTITVPNIYSLPHAESIKKFVEDNTNIGGVDIISESDAVAYYVLEGEDAKESEKLRKFKAELQETLDKRKGLCIVTIDVGKGTTDLSCILKQEPNDTRVKVPGLFSRILGTGPKKGEETVRPGRQRHSVQGKTGKSSGGNYLNYIIAKYYDERLRAEAAGLERATGFKVPFFFLEKDQAFGNLQNRTVFELANLIEKVKRGITKDYNIDPMILTEDSQRQLIGRVIDEILYAINPQWNESSQGEYDFFRQCITDVLILPQKFRRSFWQRVFSRAPAPPAENLQRSLQAYVKENVDDLLDSLKKQVKEHQAADSRGEEIDSNAFVVVSGQASQFKPLRQRIVAKCKDMGIREEHQYMMEGVASKEACCKGVITFKTANVETLFPRQLHGTYGCLAKGIVGIENQFKPFDMAKIRQGGRDTISFKFPTAYYIVFTPRAYEEALISHPLKNDGSTALIDIFEDEHEFTIEYDEKELQLTVNGRVLELRTFGNASESIFPKVWPEILAPADR